MIKKNMRKRKKQKINSSQSESDKNLFAPVTREELAALRRRIEALERKFFDVKD